MYEKNVTVPSILSDQRSKFAFMNSTFHSEVRDLMDEYLKRLQINLGKPQLQLADTRQTEISLSAQLTRLKVLFFHLYLKDQPIFQ